MARQFHLRLLINPDHARLWYSQAISSAGDSVFGTALVLWVSQVLGRGQPWAPAAVSGILATGAAAYAVIGPAAGIFVDRWDRKATMAGSEAIRVALAGGLAGLTCIPVRDLPVWSWLTITCLAVFTMTGAAQFFRPARFAASGDLVPGHADRVRAAGLSEAATSAAYMIGPPIAAPLVFTVGVHWVLAVAGTFYAISCLAIRSMTMAPACLPAAGRGDKDSLRGEFTAGLRTFSRHRFLVSLLTVTVICQCGTGAISTLNVFFVIGDLHALARLFGFAEMMMGAGFVTGAIAAGHLVRRFGARSLTWAGLVAAGTLAAGYAVQRSFPAALIILALYASLIAMLNTTVAPLLLAAVPREYLGRVMAVFNPVNHLACLLAMAGSGWLASTLPPGFRVSVGDVTLDPVSLIFVIAAGLIITAGIRAFAALPQIPG
jgi:MFS family permease